MDVQRPVAALGQGRVLVAGEIGKGRAGHLHQLQADATGCHLGHHDAAGVRPIELEDGRRSVAVLAGEEDLARLEAVAVGRRHERRLEGNLRHP